MTRKKDNATKADNKYDRLSKIGELRTLGILTEEEFQRKEKILMIRGINAMKTLQIWQVLNI